MSQKPSKGFTAASLKRHAKKHGLPPPVLKPRKKVAAIKKRSLLELKFARIWRELKGPEIVEEYKFHPVRKWRFDFAHHESMTALEIDGGIWNGRHTRGAGYEADCLKLLAAWHLGWTTLKLTPKMICNESIEAIINKLTK